MTLQLNDHCHLDTNSPPTATYHVMHQGYDPHEQVPMAVERTLTGKLKAHLLLDSSGDPVQLTSHAMTLMVSQAEKTTLESLIGKPVYYIPNWHDDSDQASYVISCKFNVQRGGMIPVDPKGTYWYVQLEILDDTL
jgi:hypothetical protein